MAAIAAHQITDLPVPSIKGPPSRLLILHLYTHLGTSVTVSSNCSAEAHHRSSLIRDCKPQIQQRMPASSQFGVALQGGA